MKVADWYYTEVLTQLGQRFTVQLGSHSWGPVGSSLIHTMLSPSFTHLRCMLTCGANQLSLQVTACPLAGSLGVPDSPCRGMPYLSFLGSICGQCIFKPRIHATCCELSFQEVTHNLLGHRIMSFEKMPMVANGLMDIPRLITLISKTSQSFFLALPLHLCCLPEIS